MRCTNRKCPVCGCEKIQRIEQIKMELPKEYKLPNQYWIVECRECGFCYADTSASEKDYDNYYSECNFYSGTPVDDSAWDSLYDPAMEMINKCVDSKALILDMGFGKGVFLRRLKQEGYANIFGLDPSEESVRLVQNNGIAADVGSIFGDVSEKYKAKFSCVALFDVLEHLLDPDKALQHLSEYLNEEGYLIISVPNYGCLRYNNYPITNMFNQEHINYFSPDSLEWLLSRHGFRKKECLKYQEDQEEIICIYKKSDSVNNAGVEYKRDDITAVEIRQYTQKFIQRKIAIERRLSDIRQSGMKCLYIWGTGAYTMWLLANSTIKEFNITFVDNNIAKVGTKLGNGEIISPSQITDKEVPILICSMLYAEQIRQQAIQMGIKNPMYLI